MTIGSQIPDTFVDWQFIVRQIRSGRCAAIISNRLVLRALFGSDDVVSRWADEIEYPLADCHNLTRVAQYASVSLRDATHAKSNYLAFLNRALLEAEHADPVARQRFFDMVQREAGVLTPSQVAFGRLNHPDFKSMPDHPLSILASLDMPVYLTTSHHSVMQAALKSVEKTPQTEVYCWREGLQENLPAGCRNTSDYQPDVKAPLVYHLHGIDDAPDSMVLTEDDHMEFLVSAAQDVRETGGLPSTVRNVLSSWLLILLGYHPDDWELRVIMQGLIRSRPRRPRSFVIQAVPAANGDVTSPERFQEYLGQYFDQAQFNVFWGDSHGFLQKLWESWNT